ncbi:MAG: branched-chain amino acid transporter AzlD [Ruminococcaceae bacterium]|nr:branched-chain amino acid transporter AzlD [Oscillospiraceae bacterium]
MTPVLSAPQALASIAVMAAVTFLTRALPFLLFDRGDHPPRIVLYLGQVLPPAIITMLIIYCLKGISFAAPAGWLPSLIAGLTAVILHLWKGNDLISIFGATALYMLLVQAVFN